MTENETQMTRKALVESLPSDTSLHGSEPARQHVYVPPSHVKALRLECSLVIGGRGVGKTFWSTALRSEDICRMLERELPELSGIVVWSGYGERPDPDAYPDSDVFASLISNGIEPYHVWRAVLGRQVATFIREKIPSNSWRDTIEWVKHEPESFARMLQRVNERFEAEGRHGSIIFDALDRSSRDWRTMDAIVSDLLRVLLSLKPYRRLHGKVFLREDQFIDRRVTDFPDASKLLATRVDLSWGLQDLHGLLWQYLCNGPGEYGDTLREIHRRIVGLPPDNDGDVWMLDHRLKRNEGLQRSLFSELAGEWMGRDRRRGVPYTWIVGHLADGRGRTSPRSFLAAIRRAAEDSLECYSAHPCPLHYESIKRGVQKASEIRVAELAEDYPWVKKLMEPLRGLTVPCEFSVVEQRWKETLGDAPNAMTFHRLPPEHMDRGWFGIRNDLESLGIFETMKDGRMNMPDLYRVGFGLGRRGGVRPFSKG